MSALIYIIIIVALCTYFAMFNINSLAQGFGQIYDIKKKHVVRVMKCDRLDSWKLLGQRFEVFRPKHETPEPSEWYVPLYALTHPAAVLGLARKSTAAAGKVNAGEEKACHSARSGSIVGLFRKRKTRPKQPDEPDQPWVMG